jgi:hypothetical protein
MLLSLFENTGEILVFTGKLRQNLLPGFLIFLSKNVSNGSIQYVNGK